MNKLKVSRGGGSNTTYFGHKFETKTDFLKFILLNLGFIESKIKKKNKISYSYLSKTTRDKTIVFASQRNFKLYIKHTYDIDVFRYPDEACIVKCNNTGEIHVKILEKKEQCVSGSVETKLWSGPSLKREYEIVFGGGFSVHYGFCVNEFLKKKLTSDNKKYRTLNEILQENEIPIFFGDDDYYFDSVKKWFDNSL